MKRGAEKQLSKDDQQSDEETEDISTAFKKADESALAGRKIRSLPKRTLAGSTVAASNGTPTSEPVTTPKFSGFAGFGAATTNNTFTFTAPTAKPASLTSQEPQLMAAATTSTSVSTTATTTAKALASFLGAPPDTSTSQKLDSAPPTTSLAFPLIKSPPTNAPALSIAPSPLTKAESSATANDSAVKYYTDLRGLNVSLISALSKATLEDPFIDFAHFLEQYKSKRSNIQNDYDKARKSETEVNETDKTDTTKLKNPPTMPAPPSSFLFGDKPVAALSFKAGGSSNGGGFKPAPSTTADASSPFRLSSTTSITPEASNDAASGKKPASSSFFGFGASTSAATTSPTFGSSTKSDFKSIPPLSTTIAGTATPTFGTTSAFPSPPMPGPFTKPPPTASAFNPFGKPSGSGSIGNPVGFGFGANSDGSKGANGDKFMPPSGFAFAQPSSSPFGALAPANKIEDREGESEEATAGGEDASAAEGGDAAKTAPSGNTLHDVEGEGEEDEETTHSARVKAYRMRKDGERGGAGWAELGVGNLRLKRHRETDARRILLRNSSTGKININFKIYAGLKVSSRAKKELTFIGHDSEGTSQTYSIRLPNEDQVHELKEAIEREVALIEPKER